MFIIFHVDYQLITDEEFTNMSMILLPNCYLRYLKMTKKKK